MNKENQMIKKIKIIIKKNLKRVILIQLKKERYQFLKINQVLIKKMLKDLMILNNQNMTI